LNGWKEAGDLVETEEWRIADALGEQRAG
jgi:hypothetical protein